MRSRNFIAVEIRGTELCYRRRLHTTRTGRCIFPAQCAYFPLIDLGRLCGQAVQRYGRAKDVESRGLYEIAHHYVAAHPVRRIHGLEPETDAEICALPFDEIH